MSTVLKYELNTLEQVMTTLLADMNDTSAPISEQQVQATQTLLASEEDRIKKIWVHEIYAFEDERQLERYIQLHQQELIRLLDLLASKQPASKEIICLTGIRYTTSPATP